MAIPSRVLGGLGAERVRTGGERCGNFEHGTHPRIRALPSDNGTLTRTYDTVLSGGIYS